MSISNTKHKQSMDGIERNRFSVVMLPFIAYSHTSAFLELAKRITTQNFHIYFCSTPINLKYIKNRIDSKYSKSIELVELNLETLPDLPPHYHTTNGLPLHLNKTLLTAFEKSSPAFTTILQNLRPNLLIYDFNEWWAADVASRLNIPSVQFLTVSAIEWSEMLCRFKPIVEKYHISEIELKGHEIIFTKGSFGVATEISLKELHSFFESMKRSRDIILIKSVWELERKYIDYISETLEKKVLPISPLIQNFSKENDHEHVEIFQWLDMKEVASVVFVSFGSECYLSDKEIEELAYVLELSNICFIWVIRFPDGSETTIEQVLPRGFLDRIGERGMVLEKWAPQTKILSHSSTGGFVSHCGWNSVLESICYGVPIIGMPMKYDQPGNAGLVEEIGVGLIVSRDGDGRLKKEEMTKIVKKIMVEEGGGCIRKKAKEMSEIMRSKEDEEVDKTVIDCLVKLCQLEI